MRGKSILAMTLTSLVLVSCSSGGESGKANTGGAEKLKVGFITKFPVDFYDIMVDAVKKYDSAHADVEVVFGQGKSGTDDEGVINTIENMIAQNVKAIAVTPTSPAVKGALDKAVKAGI